MADSRIQDLPAIDAVETGDLFPVAREGDAYNACKVTAGQMTDFIESVAQPFLDGAQTAAGEATTAAETAKAEAEKIGSAVDDAKAAQTAAESARDEAVSAVSGIEEKVQRAETAASSAAGSAEIASSAETSAVAASGSAESAKVAAETAQSAAESARDTAVSSSGQAQQSAQSAAQSAQAAQEAQVGAEAAQTGVTEARDAAQAAATQAQQSATSAGESAVLAGESAASAETAKTAAENANSEAQSAKADAESAKTAAESAKVSAESSASSASADAQSASQSASSAQAAQEAAEAAKTAAESAKSSVESYASQAQDSATQAAQSASAARQSATAAESAKTSAEAARDDAQSAKTVAESAKDGAEIAQQTAQAAATAAELDAQEAAQSAQTAQQYSGNPAKPINGTWWIWNAETGEYEDSGIKSVLAIVKSYPSISSMQADVGNMKEGDLVIIATDDISDPDNSRLYVHNGSAWVFLSDLSGIEGVGIAKIEQTAGTHAPGTTDTYTITLTDGSSYQIEVYNGADGEGAGDMLRSVYDTTGKNTDVYAYADSAVTVHSDRIDNPHSVTAEQVGARPVTWTPTAEEVGADPAGSASAALESAKNYTDQQIAAIPTPDVSGQIAAHNESGEAHPDIREELAGKETAGSAALVQDNLDTHASDKQNPHNTTAEQVGADPAGSSAAALSQAKSYTDQQIAAIPTPDVSGQIAIHNSSAKAHQDIRTALAGKEIAGAAESVQSNLDNHIADLQNPHEVTAIQVGADPAGSATAALETAKSYTDQKIAAIPTPDVPGQISQHNADTAAHPDIRALIPTSADQVGADPAGSASQALMDAKSYTDSLVGDIASVLDVINGEVI